MTESTTPTTPADAPANTLQTALADLIAKLPAEMRPIAEKYGPALIYMSPSQIYDWVDSLIFGDPMDAYATILAKLDNAELRSAWVSLNADWEAANKANAAAVQLQKDAIHAILAAVLQMALTLLPK